MYKWMKRGAIVAGAGLVVALALFGRATFSYLGTSINSVRTAARDSVPVEFELRRAQRMLDDVLPELQANVRIIAQEEVEIEMLRREIESAQERLLAQRRDVELLSSRLEVRDASYQFGGRTYSRQEVQEDLSRRFERYREAEMVLAGKQRLLETRQQSLRAAMTMLDRARAQKALLEEQIAGLEAQHRLIVASSHGTEISIDQGRLAEADRLIRDLRKRLDVAERVLAHEARFVDHIPLEVVDEASLLAEIREHLRTAPEPIELAGDHAPNPVH